MAKFDANKIEVTEQEKIKAIGQLGIDMTKHFNIQGDIKKMVALIRITLFVSSFVVVLMIGSILYLITNLGWVAQQRKDIAAARADILLMQKNSDKRDSSSNVRDSTGNVRDSLQKAK